MNYVKGLAMAGVVVALAGCSGNKEEVFQPTFQGGPRLSVDRVVWDFGEVPAGKTLNPVFQLRNLGDRSLVIEKAFTRVVEGCCPTQPELEATKIPPGKSSALALEFTMTKGMTGLHVFEVLVSSNDAVEPEALLTIRALYVKD